MEQNQIVKMIFDDDNRMLDESVEFLNEDSGKKVIRQVHDKKWRKKMLMRRAELAIAREKGDPLFNKYVKGRTLWKKSRNLIHEKYASQANKRVKAYLAAQKKAKASKK